MTDEELQKEILDLGKSLDSLPEPSESQSKEEKKCRDMLIVKKAVLEKIKEAREKNEKNQELYHTMVYGLLTSWGEKHPYLAYLARANLRWSMF